MFDPLFASGLGIDAEGATTLIIKGLAVGGGFLLGYFLGATAAWALDRWAFAHKAPPQLKKFVALLSGVALAVLVALILFGEGGAGLFGPGGNRGEKGTPNTDGKDKQTPQEQPKEVPKEKVPPKLKEVPKPTPGDVRVAILGGEDVQDGRFYQIDDNPTPKTFEEFKQAILGKQNASKTELTIIFRFKRERLSENHPAVRQVVAWVNESKLLNRFE
jgi:hypothetical protein